MGLARYVDTFKELIVIYTATLVVAAMIFTWAESAQDINFFKAMYWAGTTGTSTGYGDITPKTVIGMLDAFILQHVAIFFIAPLIILRHIERLTVDVHKFTDEEQRAMEAQLARIENYLKKLSGEEE